MVDPYFILIVFVLITGTAVGYILSEFLSTREGKKGLFPSIKFNIHKFRVHIHHWFISLIGILALIKYNVFSLNLSVFMFLFGNFFGSIIHDVRTDKHWKKLIYRNRKL